MKNEQYDSFAPKKSLFPNLKEAIGTIDSIISALFIEDRTLTPEEYQSIKEATIWIKLNASTNDNFSEFTI